MKTHFRLAVLFGALLLPQTAWAWGHDVHRLITDRAIELLPPSIRLFFQKHRAFIVEHSVDPDFWRSVGFDEEPSRHFFNLDAYGRYPFSDLPRNHQSAIERFGREKVDREGQLPWRAAEIYGRLVQAFQQRKTGNKVRALEDIKFLASVLSHYVSDAHVPFHAVRNYDGQLTHQDGIHSRFETETVLRFQAELELRPREIFPVGDAANFIFDTLLKSFKLVDPVLKADREALAGRQAYDDDYFASFFLKVQSILQQRLAESITATASLVAAAWEKGGRPELPLTARPTIPRTTARTR